MRGGPKLAFRSAVGAGALGIGINKCGEKKRIGYGLERAFGLV